MVYKSFSVAAVLHVAMMFLAAAVYPLQGLAETTSVVRDSHVTLRGRRLRDTAAASSSDKITEDLAYEVSTVFVSDATPPVLLSHMTVDPLNRDQVYLSDHQNHAIYVLKWSAEGGEQQPELYAGSPGQNGSAQGDMHRLTARFTHPRGLCADSMGHLFVVDQGNYVIRRIDRITGMVTVVAGVPGEAKGPDVGPAHQAHFSSGVFDLLCAPGGHILVSDTGTRSLKRLHCQGGSCAPAGPPGASGGLHVPYWAAALLSPLLLLGLVEAARSASTWVSAKLGQRIQAARQRWSGAGGRGVVAGAADPLLLPGPETPITTSVQATMSQAVVPSGGTSSALLLLPGPDTITHQAPPPPPPADLLDLGDEAEGPGTADNIAQLISLDTTPKTVQQTVPAPTLLVTPAPTAAAAPSQLDLLADSLHGQAAQAQGSGASGQAAVSSPPPAAVKPGGTDLSRPIKAVAAAGLLEGSSSGPSQVPDKSNEKSDKKEEEEEAVADTFAQLVPELKPQQAPQGAGLGGPPMRSGPSRKKGGKKGAK